MGGLSCNLESQSSKLKKKKKRESEGVSRGNDWPSALKVKLDDKEHLKTHQKTHQSGKIKKKIKSDWLIWMSAPALSSDKRVNYWSFAHMHVKSINCFWHKREAYKTFASINLSLRKHWLITIWYLNVFFNRNMIYILEIKSSVPPWLNSSTQNVFVSRSLELMRVIWAIFPQNFWIHRQNAV